MDALAEVGVGPTRRVLVVEDDADIRDSMSSILEDAGYRVDACFNGREALDRLQTDPADAVVLDLMMPVMNGWEFVTAKRADPAIAEIPVVAISADNSPKATAIRADSYIPKPFDADDLVAAVGRVLLEADKRKLAQRLDETERLALLGTIAAGVGHELNNPVGLAMANVAILEQTLLSVRERIRAGSRVQRHEEVIARITGPLETMEKLLRDCRGDLDRIRLIVRDLSRVSRRAGEERTSVELPPLLDSVISMAWGQLDPRVALVRKYEPDVKVVANQSRLCQVFLNLVVNAAQSIPKDGNGHHRIVVSVGRTSEWAVIDVRDTGRGMTPAQKDRIFEPFFTTRGRQGGTGLGLAICKEIVEGHGGFIDVASELGRGSTFTVRLPVALASSQGQ